MPHHFGHCVIQYRLKRIWQIFLIQKVANNLEILLWLMLLFLNFLTAKIGEPWVDTQEYFELGGLFDGWNQSELFQIRLKNLASVLHWVLTGLVCELIGGLWELDWWVLVNQRFVEHTECLILLVGCPWLVIEVHQDHVFGVRALIWFLFDHLRLVNWDF